MTPRSLVPGVVVDASAAVELLLRTESGYQVDAELRQSRTVAPAHLDAEVLSAIGRLARAGELDEGAVAPALEELARAPFARYPVTPLLRPAWALRESVSLRDALYVALARRLSFSLLTADARLARASQLGIAVTVVGL